MIIHGIVLNTVPGLLLIFILSFIPLTQVFLLSFLCPLPLSIAQLTFSLFLIHWSLLSAVPMYYTFCRDLTFPVRLLYTSVLMDFLGRLCYQYSIPNTHADVSGSASLSQFYLQKSRNVRKRMLHDIPHDIKRAGVEIQSKSSASLGLQHLLLLLFHVSRVSHGNFKDIYLSLNGAFASCGTLTEYKINGKLVAFSIAFVQGSTFTIFLYGCSAKMSKTGLWFYNVRVHVERAIRCGAKYVNGTMATHKAEAKKNAGFEISIDKEFNQSLYGKGFLKRCNEIPYFCLGPPSDVLPFQKGHD
eukprot:TRINITY_DN11758_c0_g1_i1.p1 TRINITY_DN11758_c0_g1~~TRINITY_DN11758_c0_g1_i1.p1  ORF type:complete len:326 (-),score=47.35 TRINITY_DN11758_c0_g1_i1:179-1081(-)